MVNPPGSPGDERHASRSARRRVEVLGLPIDALSHHEVLAHIVGKASAGRGGIVLTPNLELLRQSLDPRRRHHFERADLVVADGAPLVVAARLAGTPLPERVAGSDLIWTLSEAARDAGLSVFLLGGDPGTADSAAAALTGRYPGLDIAGTHFPPFGFDADPDALEAIDAALARAAPKIVFVGLPFPKQAELAERLHDAMPHAWYLCVGVSFSFVSGDLTRAPQAVQRLGLEWLWRLSQEPRRLFKRYLVHGLPFAGRLAWWALRRRAGSALRRG